MTLLNSSVSPVGGRHPSQPSSVYATIASVKFDQTSFSAGNVPCSFFLIFQRCQLSWVLGKRTWRSWSHPCVFRLPVSPSFIKYLLAQCESERNKTNTNNSIYCPWLSECSLYEIIGDINKKLALLQYPPLMALALVPLSHHLILFLICRSVFSESRRTLATRSGKRPRVHCRCTRPCACKPSQPATAQILAHSKASKGQTDNVGDNKETSWAFPTQPRGRDIWGGKKFH